MSPRKTVVLKRWQVVTAFVALALSYVGGLWAIQHQRTIARHETQARIAALQKVAVDSCRSRHLIVSIDIDQLEQGIVEGHRVLNGPTGELPGVREIVLRGIARNRKLLRRARAADCTRAGLPATVKHS